MAFENRSEIIVMNDSGEVYTCVNLTGFIECFKPVRSCVAILFIRSQNGQ